MVGSEEFEIAAKRRKIHKMIFAIHAPFCGKLFEVN